MLRVLSICKTLPTPSVPSSGVFVGRRLAALNEIAHVRVIQPVPYFPVMRPLPGWSRNSHEFGGLKIEPAPMLYFPGVLKSLDGRLLARSVRRKTQVDRLRSSVDLIDAHFGYPDGVGAMHVAKAADLPLFITVRGNENDYLRTDGIRQQLKVALNRAAGCICVSHSLRALLIENGVNASAARVIPNGIDRTMFFPADKELARTQLGVAHETPLVVSVGTIIALKRHHVLIEAMSSIRERHKDGRLVIIGGERDEKGYLPRLKQLAREAGIGDSVTFTGPLPPATVASWMQAADVFALATSREGCCNAVLEALAAGLPVVTTPAGDNAHYVTGGSNGFIVPIDDANAMGRAIGNALAMTWDREQVSRGLAVGGWSDVAKDVVSFYEERLASWQGYAPVSNPGART